MLKLDETTHDLFVTNFQFTPIGLKTEDLAQRLKMKLLFFKGEWFLDEDYGMPYFQEIFVKGTSKETIDDRFRIAIAQERGVDRLLEYSSVFDSSTRVFSVTATVKTTEGEVITIPLSL
jgi:hypothetical protein